MEENVVTLNQDLAHCASTIHNPGYLKDHLFQGKPVLPAVEAMEALADQAKHIDPECLVTTIADACFDKFLVIDPDIDLRQSYLYGPPVKSLLAKMLGNAV